MTGLVIIALVCVIAPALWLALEVCRAPLAYEGPNGLCVVAPGGTWVRHLPGFDDSVPPLLYWGVG